VEDSMHIRNRSLKLKIKPRLILCIFYGWVYKEVKL
jgi:hypothetical protein